MSLWEQEKLPTSSPTSLDTNLLTRETSIRAQRSWQLDTPDDTSFDPFDQQKTDQQQANPQDISTFSTMSSKDLDVEMAETKEQPEAASKITIKRAKTKKEIKHEQSTQDLRAAYEAKKRLIPILCRWNNITFYLSMFGILITVAEMELSRHLYNNDSTSSFIPLLLKITMTVSTILCCFSLIRYWTVKIDIFRSKELVHKTATVWNTKKFRNSLILELFVTALHVPPYLDTAIGFIYGDLHFNVLGILVFLRLYIVPRTMKQQFKKKFITHKVRLIGAINRVPFNSFFVTKAMLTLKPFKVILGFLFTFVICISYALTQFEINIPNCNDPNVDSDRCHPAGIYFWQWVVFSFALILGIEPTTVPMSILGQIITIFGAMVGTCLVAILIAVIADSLTLSTTESRVVDQIRAHTLSKNRKMQALHFIQSYWRWLVAIKKRLPPDVSVRESGMLHGETNPNFKLTSKDRRVREKLVVAMHEWRSSKRKGAQESQLTSISKDVSTVIDEVTHVKSWARSTEKQVDAMNTKLDQTLNTLNQQLDTLTFSLTGKKRSTKGNKNELDALLVETRNELSL